MKTSWDKRATRYNNLQWANHDLYFQLLLEELRLTGEEDVLDIGTGTGKIAYTVQPYCKKVIGVDSSQQMLDIANKNLDVLSHANISFRLAPVDKLPFDDGSFDVVIARMVFHHVLENLTAAVKECFRVLRRGGRIVIAEGVPPNYRLKEDFVEIFKLKEKRHTFFEEDIMKLVADAGFHRVNVRTFFMDAISINNWLDHADIPKENAEKIKQLHRGASVYFKEAYRLREENGDIFIDMKHAIVTAEKY
jgi:ubiquinone/menaquinone biosynthesis C-methylase UbiE